jgi:phasin
MTTTTTAKAAHVTPKAATAPFETAAFQEFAEKSVSTARDTYAKFKSATDDAAALVEDTFATAREGALAIGVKALDAGKTNSEASFALVKDLFGAKTMSDVMELQSAFARKQFEAFTEQFKEFQGLTQQLMTDTTKPVTDKVHKTLKDLQVA